MKGVAISRKVLETTAETADLQCGKERRVKCQYIFEGIVSDA